MVRGKIRTAADAEAILGLLISALGTCPEHDRRIAAIRLRHDADAHGRDKGFGKLALALADHFDPEK